MGWTLRSNPGGTWNKRGRTLSAVIAGRSYVWNDWFGANIGPFTWAPRYTVGFSSVSSGLTAWDKRVTDLYTTSISLAPAAFYGRNYYEMEWFGANIGPYTWTPRYKTTAATETSVVSKRDRDLTDWEKRS